MSFRRKWPPPPPRRQRRCRPRLAHVISGLGARLARHPIVGFGFCSQRFVSFCFVLLRYVALRSAPFRFVLFRDVALASFGRRFARAHTHTLLIDWARAQSGAQVSPPADNKGRQRYVTIITPAEIRSRAHTSFGRRSERARAHATRPPAHAPICGCARPPETPPPPTAAKNAREQRRRRRLAASRY